jgi:hypothetical protein
MKRVPIFAILLLIPAFAIMPIVGCKDDKKPEPKKADNDGKPAAEAKPIACAPGGSVVKGVVKFEGEAPEAKPEEKIQKHDDKKVCMEGKAKNPHFVTEQKWFVKDGLVENVVVSLEPAEGFKYAVDDKLKDIFKKKEAILDQPYCAYTPHILALYADVQPLLVKNSSSISHNTKVVGGPTVGSFDEIIKPKSQAEKGAKTYGKSSRPIQIQCSMHTWMNAQMLTFDHPYFAVTNDKGEFRIENVPTDADLVVYMWHESMDNKKKEKTLKIAKGDNVVDLKISK